MIRIEKPKFSDDRWWKCCNNEIGDVMDIKFFVKNNQNVSTSISLCGKCRAELREQLAGEMG